MNDSERLKKVTKHLKKTKWYHGTRLINVESIKNKIDVEHNIGRELDFGHGFYLMPNFDDTCKFIEGLINHDDKTLIDIFEDDYSIGIVIEFEIINFIDMFEGDKFETKFFEGYTDEFSEFVFAHRVEPSIEHHHFDFIFGPETDSEPIHDIRDYRDDNLTKEQVLHRLKKNTSFKQMLVRNQFFCDTMYITNIYWSKSKKEATKLCEKQ